MGFPRTFNYDVALQFHVFYCVFRSLWNCGDFICTMKKVLLLILFSIAILGIRAQGYVPKVGETIMFYPLTEKAKQEYHGYDCFYDVTKVISNGKYKFKKGYQYKCDKNGLTSFDEIEGKTFKVLKAENFLHNEKKENKVFLLFLSCIEDGSEIVLRVPFFEKNASFLTRSLISEKIEGYLQNKVSGHWDLIKSEPGNRGLSACVTIHEAMSRIKKEISK